MEVYTIPYENRYIIYRPLLRLAFAANAAMVNLIAGITPENCAGIAIHHPEAYEFLKKIGFLEPDPERSPDLSFQAPDTGILCLTNTCNLRCIYCYAAAGEKTLKKISVSAGKTVIDTVWKNAADAGRSFFSIGFHGGGEPTAAMAELQVLVDYARSKPLPSHLSLTTNACWPHPAVTWILDQFDAFSISFDGLETIQNRQRPRAGGTGSFNQVMNVIHRLDQKSADYGIRMTVTDESVDYLSDGVGFLCRETDCRTIQVEPAFARGRAARKSTALSDFDRFETAFLDAYDTASACGRHLYYSGARPWLITERFCESLFTSIILTPDNTITGCLEVIDSDHPLMDLFYMGRPGDAGIDRINREARKRLAKMILARQAHCRNCFCFWHCAGDCPAKALLAPDPSLGENPRCRLNRRLTKALIIRYMAAEKLSGII